LAQVLDHRADFGARETQFRYDDPAQFQFQFRAFRDHHRVRGGQVGLGATAINGHRQKPAFLARFHHPHDGGFAFLDARFPTRLGDAFQVAEGVAVVAVKGKNVFKGLFGGVQVADLEFLDAPVEEPVDVFGGDPVFVFLGDGLHDAAIRDFLQIDVEFLLQFQRAGVLGGGFEGEGNETRGLGQVPAIGAPVIEGFGHLQVGFPFLGAGHRNIRHQLGNGLQFAQGFVEQFHRVGPAAILHRAIAIVQGPQGLAAAFFAPDEFLLVGFLGGEMTLGGGDFRGLAPGARGGGLEAQAGGAVLHLGFGGRIEREDRGLRGGGSAQQVGEILVGESVVLDLGGGHGHFPTGSPEEKFEVGIILCVGDAQDQGHAPS